MKNSKKSQLGRLQEPKLFQEKSTSHILRIWYRLDKLFGYELTYDEFIDLVRKMESKNNDEE